MRVPDLLVNPLQAFDFVIFILVLQQVDGNVIGPKILGNTVGISGFWVLASITIKLRLRRHDRRAGVCDHLPAHFHLLQTISFAKKNPTTDTTAYCRTPTVSFQDRTKPPHRNRPYMENFSCRMH